MNDQSQYLNQAPRPDSLPCWRKNLLGILFISVVAMAAVGLISSNVSAGGPEPEQCPSSWTTEPVGSGGSLYRTWANSDRRVSWPYFLEVNSPRFANPSLVHPNDLVCVPQSGAEKSAVAPKPIAKAPAPEKLVTPAITSQCTYDKTEDGLPRLTIKGPGECAWPYTDAVSPSGNFAVWPADLTAGNPIARNASVGGGCPPGLRGGDFFCWDGGKIVGGSVRIRVGEGVRNVVSLKNEPIPAYGGPKNCYYEDFLDVKHVWWCAPPP